VCQKDLKGLTHVQLLPILILEVNNWFRLGIWVALTAGFYILVNEVLQHHPLYETWRWHIWKGLVGAGVFLGLISKIFSRAPAATPAASASGGGGIRFHDDDEAGHSAPFFTLRYCAFILSTFGVIVRVVIPDSALDLKVAARDDSKAAPSTNAAPEPVVVEFPNLSVRGVFYSKTRPSAFVNNKTCFLGDDVEGAKIVSILPDSIVVEKGGSQKTFLLKH
jgi:hypothetical protein